MTRLIVSPAELDRPRAPFGTPAHSNGAPRIIIPGSNNTAGVAPIVDVFSPPRTVVAPADGAAALSIEEIMSRGLELDDQGQAEDAERLYRQVICQVAPALHALGGLLARRDAVDDARVFRRAAEFLRSDIALLNVARGREVLDRGDYAAAKTASEAALAIDETCAPALELLGLAHEGLGQMREAGNCFERGIRADPQSSSLWHNLARCLYAASQITQAASAAQTALRLPNPDRESWTVLAACLLEIGCFDQAARLAELAPNRATIEESILLYANADSARNPHEVAAAHFAAGAKTVAEAESFRRPHDNDKTRDRRLRVGYVSPDLRDHSVAYFLKPILAAHDPSAVEVHVYHTFQRQDGMTEVLRGLVPNWHDAALLSDAELADRIRADRIDVLIDLAGYTAAKRLRVFARRPAPVQLSYLGYPATTGLSTVDAYVTDALIDPPGAHDDLFCESLVRPFTSAHCFDPGDGVPEINMRRARPDSICFGSFNAYYKLSDATIDLWSRVLQAVPGSRLLIKNRALFDAKCRAVLESRFDQRDIDPDRLALLSAVPSRSAHLDMYGRVDIGLDTFPYNGTTTTCQALWMGVPVITLAGAAHASRVGASLLQHVGLEDLVSSELDAFVVRAVALSADVERLFELRSTLRARMRESPLFDAKGLTRGLEATYQSLFAAWCRTAAS